MKSLRHIRSSGLRCCAVVCLAAASVCAQSLPPPLLLELKSCGRELQIFENGTVVESREGIKTARNLSANRMRKLRNIIENGPCERLWRPAPPAVPPGELPTVSLTTFKLDPSNNDCWGEWRGVAIGLQEVVVTPHHPGYQGGPFPVYILCERAREADKKYAGRYPKNKRWPRFFSDVERALGGKSFLKGCACR